MNHGDREALLRYAAGRAAAEGFFMGSALALYQAEHGLDEAALAAWLGCEADRLSRLGLCRRPDPESERFRAEVQQIATYTGVQVLRLAALLREVDAAEALRSSGHTANTLLAARDAEDETVGERE